MMSYRCRMKIPQETDWMEVEAATPAEAAHVCHDQLYERGQKGIGYTDRRADDFRQRVYFALMETEGFEPWVSRIYYSGIWRKGGVLPPAGPTLMDIAKQLGWTAAPEKLLEEGWECEETWEQAQRRQHGQ